MATDKPKEMGTRHDYEKKKKNRALQIHSN